MLELLDSRPKLRLAVYLLLSLLVLTVIMTITMIPTQNNAKQTLSNGDDSAIAALQSRTNDLHASATRWNDRYLLSLVLAVLLGAATVVFQYKAIRVSQDESDAQSELLHLKDIKAAKDSQEKDRLIGEVNKQAGEANERASKLEAGNLQLRIDLETATAESRKRQAELEIEQRKNAEAQRAAVEAQLVLKHNIEYAATPRRIILGSRNDDGEIRGAKFKELEKYANTPAIVLYVQDEEAKMLAFDIGNALLKSGWKVNIGEAAATNIPLGFIDGGVQCEHF